VAGRVRALELALQQREELLILVVPTEAPEALLARSIHSKEDFPLTSPAVETRLGNTLRLLAFLEGAVEHRDDELLKEEDVLLKV